jgi:hypothetical protein
MGFDIKHGPSVTRKDIFLLIMHVNINIGSYRDRLLHSQLLQLRIIVLGRCSIQESKNASLSFSSSKHAMYSTLVDQGQLQVGQNQAVNCAYYP